MFTHPPLVGPYQIGSRLVVIHALAGIDDEKLVDEAVAIPVVTAPVDIGFLLKHGHDVLNQVLRVLVGIIAGILHGIAYRHIHQVECQVELAITLGIEVIVNRTLKGTL